MTTRHTHLIHIEKCTSNDAHFIFDCRYDPISNANSTYRNIPSFKEHQDWFERKLKDPKFQYFKGVCECIDIGFVRFVDTDEGIEVSVYSHPDYRQKGYAGEILYEAILLRGNPEKMYSTIKLLNLASYKTFARVSERLSA